MLQGQTLTCLILLITIAKCVYTFEIFINKTKGDQIQNIDQFASFRNKSYEIPLFQTHYVTIRTQRSDLRQDNNNNSSVIGFNVQVRSTQPNIIGIRKEVMMPTRTTNNNYSNTLLINDLYILSRKRSLSHIFNAYPSPTLIHLDQKPKDDIKIDGIWAVESVTMGITTLVFRLDVFYDDDTSTTHIQSLNILVIQPKRIIDMIFYMMIPFMVISISILMGILLDPRVIASILKKPIPVLVGFVAQYGLMPFLAMAIAKLFHYTPLNSLALFVIGCCPGSGASNQWTVMFDGDVNLSAVMSFVSTATSFFMMPLYFYTLGRLYMDELSITVPFLGLARSLALVVVPYAIGITISYFFPKSRPWVKGFIKPMMIFLMVFFLTFGIFVNWYIFLMIDLYTVLTAPLLPFLGFLFGGFLAWLSRLSWPHVKTVGIEAGMQNTGIAFMIIMYSFPQPYATQALIVPMVVSILTNKPLWVILIIRDRIRKYKKRKELAKTENIDGVLVISNDKPSLENGEINKKDDTAENMQKL